MAMAGVAVGLTTLSACGSLDDEPVTTGEPLMGTPPVDGDWDGGTGGAEESDHSDVPIMGEAVMPSEPPLMGKIAPY